jgi:hypothetical protein
MGTPVVSVGVLVLVALGAFLAGRLWQWCRDARAVIRNNMKGK